MKTYHLDLLQKNLKKALEHYCLLCDFSAERQYFSNEIILSQTKEIVQQYIRLFQTLNFLDRQTEYYHHGFIFTYQETGEEITASGEYKEIIKLLLEAYQHIAESALKDRFFLPIHVQQINSEEIQIFIGVVTKEQRKYTISVVAHKTVYPSPPTSIGNDRYHYLVELLETYEPEENGSLESFVNSKGLSYVKIRKDSKALFGSPFYHHYLKTKMITVLEDLLLSTLSYKEIANKNGFTSYYRLYKLFHKIYDFPFHLVPRISLKK